MGSWDAFSAGCDSCHTCQTTLKHLHNTINNPPRESSFKSQKTYTYGVYLVWISMAWSLLPAFNTFNHSFSSTPGSFIRKFDPESEILTTALMYDVKTLLLTLYKPSDNQLNWQLFLVIPKICFTLANLKLLNVEAWPSFCSEVCMCCPIKEYSSANFPSRSTNCQLKTLK